MNFAKNIDFVEKIYLNVNFYVPFVIKEKLVTIF